MSKIETGSSDDQWLSFEANQEMVQYVCDPHEGMMNGDIDIRE